MNIINELKNRGQIQDTTDLNGLISELNNKSITFYCGFDPTADSLHVGSLLPLVVMKRLIKAGHKAIALLGTSTGMIGDPSGKSEERTLIDPKVIEHNTKSIEEQIINFLGENNNSNKLTIVKNGDWLSKLSFIEVLRDIGKHFSVNQMIAKDSVKARLTEREQGISFTEFTYMILQAIDFHHLYVNHDCQLQIGGSDQWGNITAGVDLIRRKEQEKEDRKKAFGLTIPLLINSNGKKFGKTESGNIWLSEKKTSAYAFYQFWLNSTDEDLENLFKLFTDCTLMEISDLLENHRNKPENREAQKKLAEIMTSQLHGVEKTINCQKASEILFGNKSENIDSKTLLLLKSEIPTTEFDLSELDNILITDFLMKMKVAESKTAIRKLLQNGGVSLNGTKQTNVESHINISNFIDKKVALIKIGKKNYSLATIK